MTIEPSRIAEPAFWHQALDQRMAQFAELREQGAVLPISVDNPLTEMTETFYALPRYDEVVHVSKHPELFCSGQGATSIFDLPIEMLEFFGGFINMDNPRHAHQRRIDFLPRFRSKDETGMALRIGQGQRPRRCRN